MEVIIITLHLLTVHWRHEVNYCENTWNAEYNEAFYTHVTFAILYHNLDIL